MKKMFFTIAMALLSVGAFAQTYKNEAKINILNVIVRPSIELGYEYYLDENQSVDAELMFLDRFSYWHIWSGSKEYKFSTTSFKVGYNYYFNSVNGEGASINPFLKARFGTFTENKNGVDEKTKMDAFIIGVGAGYAWVFNDKFVVAPYVNIGRNFSGPVNSRFIAIEPNAGVRVGFRF